MHPDLQAKLAALTPDQILSYSALFHQVGLELASGARGHHAFTGAAAPSAGAVPPWVTALLQTLGPIAIQLLEQLLNIHPPVPTPTPVPTA